MGGNIVLIWQQKQVDINYGVNEVVVASERISSLSISSLEQFLNRNGIDPRQIENVIFVRDLTEIIPQELKSNKSFGYLRVTPTPLEFMSVTSLMQKSNVKIHTFHLPLPIKSDFDVRLRKTLETLTTLSIKEVAVNSTFSLIDNSSAPMVIEKIEQFCPGQFSCYFSDIFNTANFLLRENNLLINLLLRQTVKALLEKIDRSLNEVGIFAPVYLLKGDGTLASSKMAEINPLATWRAKEAVYLISGSHWQKNKDTIVIFEQDQSIKMGVTEDYLPRIPEGVNKFQDIELPGRYPLTITIENISNRKKWEEAIELLNPFPGPVTLVNFSKTLDTSPVFSYPIANAPNEPHVLASGVLTAPFRWETQKMIVVNSVEEIDSVKQTLLDAALNTLDKQGVRLRKINYSFENNPLKYLPKNRVLLKLIIWGNLC